jgi:hypothetical protein
VVPRSVQRLCQRVALVSFRKCRSWLRLNAVISRRRGLGGVTNSAELRLVTPQWMAWSRTRPAATCKISHTTLGVVVL